MSYTILMQRLFPNEPMVLLLRNPVDRAYSEYQMKLRSTSMKSFHETLLGAVMRFYSACLKDPQSPTDCFESHLTNAQGFTKTMWTRSNNKQRLAKCLAKKDGNDRASEHVMKCLKPLFAILEEQVEESFETTVLREIEDVNSCMQRTDYVPQFYCVGVTENSTAEVYENCLYSVNDSAAWTLDYNNCLPKISTTIVEHFILRGLYLEQIKNLHRRFPPEQILILFDEELRYHPQETLSKVFKHVGLPDMNISHITSKMLKDKTRQAWGKSAESNGWLIQSNYKPMDPKLKVVLARFFAAHNQRLYDYLDRDFGWSERLFIRGFF